MDIFNLPDSSRVIRKKARATRGRIGGASEYDAEELVHPVARALGLNVPDIYRSGEKEMFVDFVENGKLADELRPAGEYGDDHLEKYATSPDGLRTGLLDLIILNGDRHDANWFVTDDERIIPIDHGSAFGGGNVATPSIAPEPKSVFERAFTYNPWDIGEDFEPEDEYQAGKWIDQHPVSLASMRRLRAKLEALKAQFEAMGRAQWHAAMMARFAELEKRAKRVGGIDI